jgi:transketolase N-terminal domain/subunit
MGSAPTAYCLWQRFLRYDPAGSEWLNRDRFGLSAGHASALLYSLLYLTGVKAAGPVMTIPTGGLSRLMISRTSAGRKPLHRPP